MTPELVLFAGLAWCQPIEIPPPPPGEPAIAVRSVKTVIYPPAEIVE